MPKLQLQEIHATTIDGATKGFPGTAQPLRLDELGAMNWNVLAHDLPFPVAVLKDSALRNNSDQMKKYLDATGVSLSPHGKTTMSPQLFDRQLAEGAWGLTAATTTHVNVFRKAGVQRVILANQLVGEQNVAYIASELKRDPEFEFYCLVDSIRQADQLAELLLKYAPGRPLNVLVEMGSKNGRCGVRSLEEGIELARHVSARNDVFCLAGIEVFEAIFGGDPHDAAIKTDGLLGQAVKLAEECDEAGLFGTSELLLTAGGTMYFARAARALLKASVSRKTTVVLRSGCYLTHDHGLYAKGAEFEKEQTSGDHPEFIPALEVWASVQSVPEPGLAILALGKRDISYDIQLPMVCYSAEGGRARAVAPGNYEIVALNDQHAYMRCPAGQEPKPGDLFGLGISHPCTTFDKWQLLYIVDDDYRVVEGIRTFF
ncbi:hypothetical protein BA177_03965 [Woeseia oceani]|uniref:D-serine dehydratase-like domain-containing protein n=2 Tax=Woeseia oceani TaxID=1548547 RepID=A0A193LDC1_9GAMM|nr:hypothetical protein BA177_03965 [Woeseia oceani]